MADGGRSNQDIARRVVALRESMDMNQSAFAAFVGLQQSTISNYERADRRPRLDEAIQIQMRTGITLDWLYLGDRSGLPGRLLASLPDLSRQSEAS